MNPTLQALCAPAPNSHKYRTLWLRLAAIALLACGLSSTQGQITVIDDGFSLTPDPVSVVVGGSVSWMDDGTGPYQIISDTGAWPTFSTPGGVRFTQAGTFTYHDDVGDFGTIYVNLNVPPSVTITNPAPNVVLSAPAQFVFGADASDPDSDGLSDVQFFVGTNMVDDVFSSPYTTTVSNLAGGTYTLTVVAFDNAGATATNSITITVGLLQQPPPRLGAPTIFAGKIVFSVSGLTTGKTNVLLSSTNVAAPIASWAPLSTNVAATSTMTFTNAQRTSGFFRLMQLP